MQIIAGESGPHGTDVQIAEDRRSLNLASFLIPMSVSQIVSMQHVVH